MIAPRALVGRGLSWEPDKLLCFIMASIDPEPMPVLDYAWMNTGIGTIQGHIGALRYSPSQQKSGFQISRFTQHNWFRGG